MTRRFGPALALFALLLQISQPLLAALRPLPMPVMPMAAMQMPAMSGPVHSHRTDRMPDQAVRPGAAHAAHGCCCHGGWNCGSACAAMALCTAPQVLALAHRSPAWWPPGTTRPAAAHPLELLRPPIAS